MQRPTIPDKDIPTSDPETLIYCFTPWVQKLADSYKELLANRPYVDMEDLLQAGTIGLLNAQEKYNPAIGYSFLTFSSFFIRKAMRQEIGFNNNTGELPPVPFSLDKPISAEDPEGIRLIDTIEALEDTDCQAIVERTEIQTEVRAAVAALDNPRQTEVICRIYFEEQDRRQISKAMGIKYGAVTSAENGAKTKLCHDPTLRLLANYSPSHRGLRKFNDSWESEEEHAILWKERKYDEQYGSGSYVRTFSRNGTAKLHRRP